MESLMNIVYKISSIPRDMNFYIAKAIVSKTKMGAIDAYNVEPTFAYYLLVISTVLMAAIAWVLGKRLTQGIRYFDSLFNSFIILTSVQIYLSTVELPSSTYAIFKTSNLFPHVLTSYIIGYDLQDLFSILIDNDRFKLKKVLCLLVKTLKTLLNIYVLYNTIFINIFVHYLMNFEFFRVCRLCFGGVDSIIGSPSSSAFIAISWSISLGSEFHNAFYLLYWKFESLLPEMEICILKRINVCLFIISLINMYNDKIMVESCECLKAKPTEENVSDSRLVKKEEIKSNAFSFNALD